MKWETIASGESGTFCHECKKDVVDFVALSMEDIYKGLQRKRNLCVRANIDKNGHITSRGRGEGRLMGNVAPVRHIGSSISPEDYEVPYFFSRKKK